MSLLDDLLRRLPPMPRVFRPAQPSLAAEVGEGHISLVRLLRGGSRPETGGFFVGSLPFGAMRASAAGGNIVQPEAVRAVLEAARERVAPSGGALALAIPDACVRIAVIAADAIPRRREDVRELVSWRLKKMLPFRMDEAQVDSQAYSTRDGRAALLAVAVRRKLVAEHEALFAEHGFTVGSVTPATLALAEHLPPDLEGDAMLIHVAAGWFSLFITDGREPVFFRCKLLPESERVGVGRDWFVTGEIFPTLEYYRTRLKRRGIKRVFLHVAGEGRSSLEETLATAIELPLETLRITPASILPADQAQLLTVACALAWRGVAADRRVAGTSRREESAA